MRLIIAAVTLGLLLSGCASEPAQGEDFATDSTPVQNITVPDPIQVSGKLQAAATPTGETTGCMVDQGCAEHTFTIEDTLITTVTLVSHDGTVTGVTSAVLWGSDYDLTLLKGSSSLGESTNPGNEADVIEMKLDPGTYAARVMAWNDQDGSYDLTIAFAAPPAPVAAAPADGNATA